MSEFIGEKNFLWLNLPVKTTKCSFENFQEQLHFKEICVKCLGKKVSITNFGAVGSFFMAGGNKIWTRKWIIKSLIFGVYLLFSDFLAEVSEPTRTSKNGHLFYNTVSLIKTSLILRTSSYWRDVAQVFICWRAE